MEVYENWAEEEADYYGWCRRHPSQPRHAVCAACLHERLSQLCPHCARPRPCRVCESSSSSSAASAAVFDVATSPTSSVTSSEHSVSARASDGGVAIGSVAPMSHFLGETPSFRRSRSAACGRLPVNNPQPSKQREPAVEEIKEPRSSFSSSSSSLYLFLFKRSSDKTVKAKKGDSSTKDEKPVEGLYRSRTVAAGRGSCQREVAAEMKGRGWLRSPMKAFRLPKSEKLLHPRPPLCKG